MSLAQMVGDYVLTFVVISLGFAALCWAADFCERRWPR